MERRARVPHLVEDLLEPRGAHLVRHVSVGSVGHKELLLSLEGRLDVLLPINVLLTAVHHPDVPWETEASSNQYIPFIYINNLFLRMTWPRRHACIHGLINYYI